MDIDEQMNILARMIRLAGLDPGTVISLPTSKRFAIVIKSFRDIAAGKEAQYGGYVKNMSDGPPLFQRMQMFCEIKRKFKRLEAMIKRDASSGGYVHIDEYLETLSDLGVYATHGIDLLLEQENPKNNVNVQPSQPDEAGKPSACLQQVDIGKGPK